MVSVYLKISVCRIEGMSTYITWYSDLIFFNSINQTFNIRCIIINHLYAKREK